MRSVNRFTDWLPKATNALDKGALHDPVTPGCLAWDIAGKCENPVYRETVGRSGPKKVWIYRTRTAHDRFTLELQTRCRKCAPCLRHRAAIWRNRATAEVANSVRTWFVTLTLNPASHSLMANRAFQRLRAQASDFDCLPEASRFAERHYECSKEITLFLKRVRATAAVDHRQSARLADACAASKGSRCKCHPINQFRVPLRYLLVAEAHKSGLPHYHMLISEFEESRPVRARHLKTNWRLGFSDVKLVAQDDGTRPAAYVAKYLAKSAIARVRASVGYGQHIADNETILNRSSMF